MDELDELRLKIAKAKGYRFIKLTPAPNNDARLPVRDRTCYQVYSPGEENENEYWIAESIDWPGDWQEGYRADEIPNWPSSITAAWELVKEMQGEFYYCHFSIDHVSHEEWEVRVSNLNGDGYGKGETICEAICHTWLNWNNNE